MRKASLFAMLVALCFAFSSIASASSVGAAASKTGGQQNSGWAHSSSLPCGSNCLWYNGDFNGVNGLSNENNTIVSQANVYDNVIPGANWTVGDIFSNDLVTPSTSFSAGVWEIRSGVSSGNGGTLIAGGTSSGSNFSISANGQNGFGLTGVYANCSFPSVSLSAGTEYWFTCAPQDSGSGRSFESTTSFVNQSGNGTHVGSNSFFNSTFFGANFVSACNEVGTPCDFSFGVSGSSGGGTTPEPGSLMLLGSGLLGLGGVIRRRLGK